MKRGFATVACAIAFAFVASVGAAQTLNTVKARGILNCGSNTGMAGYGIADRQGNWTGFDVDFCRALAAAIFDDPNKVKFIPTTGQNRFTALQSGDVDVLNRNTTWTSSRDTSLGLNFTGTTYYDGQGFIVRKSLKVASALELNDAAVCVSQGSTTELNLADYFRANKMKVKTATFATVDEAVKAYEAGRCDAFTTDQSGLYAQRLQFAHPEEHMVLPEIISKEPLGPSVRHGDDQWFDIVKWVHFAMLNAEEARRHVEERERDAEIREPRHQAPARDGGQLRRTARADERLGLPHHQARRKLRRGVRAQHRGEHALEDEARPQCAVDQGRPAIRAAGEVRGPLRDGGAHDAAKGGERDGQEFEGRVGVGRISEA